jgi:hypothetical protein
MAGLALWPGLAEDGCTGPPLLFESNNDVIMLGTTNRAFGVAVAPGGIG